MMKTKNVNPVEGIRAVPCDASEEALVLSSSEVKQPSVCRSVAVPPLVSRWRSRCLQTLRPDWMRNNCALQTSLFKPPRSPPPLPPPPLLLSPLPPPPPPVPNAPPRSTAGVRLARTSANQRRAASELANDITAGQSRPASDWIWSVLRGDWRVRLRAFRRRLAGYF